MPLVGNRASANQTSHRSERGQDYIRHKERGIKIHDVTLPFTYLGEVDYVSSHGDSPMNITWKLHHSVRSDLFMDFIR